MTDTSGNVVPDTIFLGPSSFTEGVCHPREYLAVYDVRGRLAATLLDERVAPGFHRREWNGADPSGRRLASGIYFVRLETDSYQATRKMVLLD